MRRVNSEFRTWYLSEEGQRITNRDDFGYVEMDDFSCYVMADSLDDDTEANSAKYVMESLIRSFMERPTMNKLALSHYMQKAHQELVKKKNGMRLKASVVMVVTDYRKMRFCSVGNSRFYLIRNGRYQNRTVDQSLTQSLIANEQLPLDQATRHEERNNLFSYLGERGNPQVSISPKIKLEDGDILVQLTRGIWENISDEEFMQAVNDAKEPQDILSRAEEWILEKQIAETEADIDNYSLAVTFVTKVFQPPQKKLTLKHILLVTIPVLLAVGAISVVGYLYYRSIKNKEYQLSQYMISGEEYLRYDNYKKASEEYQEAKKLAVGLKRQEERAEADQYLKLADQILLADETFLSGEYVKAQELYLSARELSVKAGNAGKKYVDLQLEQTRAYTEVNDWISVGEIRETYGDLTGAAEAYQQAKEKASALYATALKEEALKKQTAVEEKLAAEQAALAAAAEAAVTAAQAEQAAQSAEEQAAREAAMELENQQKVNDRKSAIELENTGNELMAEGQYEHAITFYRTAQAIYYRLELEALGDGLESKIEAAQAGSEAAKEAETQADKLPEDGS